MPIANCPPLFPPLAQARSGFKIHALADQLLARARNEKTEAEPLAAALMPASRARGARSKKNDMHRMAEANRAFAYYVPGRAPMAAHGTIGTR